MVETGCCPYCLTVRGIAPIYVPKARALQGVSAKVSLDNNTRARLFAFGLAGLFALWNAAALITGRTLWLSRTSLPRIVNRKTDAVGYWGMFVANCAIMAFCVTLGIWPQISN
jgi:hypothetical protein